MSILKKQSTRMMITMAMVHLITKTKMSAETIARKTKIRGRVADGLRVSITIINIKAMHFMGEKCCTFKYFL